MATEWRLLVEKVKRLAVPSGREALQEFTVEGHRGMERAVRNGEPLSEVLVSQSFADSGIQREREILDALGAASVPVRVAPDDIMNSLTAGRGIGEVFGVLPIPPTPRLEDLFSGEGRQLVLVGCQLADPGNTGAIIRTALAVGAAGFIAVGTTDPWHPKAVRTSMGSLFKLPILRVPEGRDWVEDLHALQVGTLASSCRDAENLADVELERQRCALVLGSEAFGLPEDIESACNRRISIPMPEGVDSFSVNAAAAVMAYTLLRG